MRYFNSGQEFVDAVRTRNGWIGRAYNSIHYIVHYCDGRQELLSQEPGYSNGVKRLLLVVDGTDVAERMTGRWVERAKKVRERKYGAK